MPGELTVRERIIALETWRIEHKQQHEREDTKRESSVNRRTIIFAAILGAIIGSIITYLLYMIFGFYSMPLGGT